MKKILLLNILLLLCGLVIPADSQTLLFKLPDTGQTQTYTNTFGEDSDYTINPPAFTENGDGSVTDNNTGLMWQQIDDGNTYNWFESTGTADATYNPSAAINVCGNFTLGGYNDWRLPSKKELISIADYGSYYPAIDSSVFPSTKTASYWSATPYTVWGGHAWHVSFIDGFFDYFDNSVPSKNNEYYVRCVRREQTVQAFTDNGDGTVTDSTTGLMWEQQPDNFSGTWEEALMYCENLDLADQTDWRPPNVKELESLTDESQYAPAIDTTMFPNTLNTGYWSSTTYISYGAGSGAYCVDFTNGGIGWCIKANIYPGVIIASSPTRCVRGGNHTVVAVIYEEHSISNVPTADEPVPYSFTLKSRRLDRDTIIIYLLDAINPPVNTSIHLTENLHYTVAKIPGDLYRITILPTAVTELSLGLSVPTGMREDYGYQAEYTLEEPILDIFGMAVGNKWGYEGTDLGQPLSLERNITVIDQNSFPTPVFVSEIEENGMFTGTEYYENEGDQIKLWGAGYEDGGVIYNLSFSQGLIAIWAPLFVGDHNYTTASTTIAEYPGYIFTTGLTVDVVGLETVTLDFGTFEAYKVNYTLTISGYGVYLSDSFSWWVVPYLGVVKDQDAEYSLKLTSFSIGHGTITQNSDADNDGLIDIVELLVLETDWQNADTDDDGIPDGWEVDYDLDPIVNDSLDDPDNDGLNNLEEYKRGSDPNDPEDPCLDIDYLVINPHFSTLTSSDTDRVVFFNSNQATCFEMVSCIKQDRVCTDEWDFGGNGDIVGGNGNDIVVYRYDAGGDYTASLTLTESVSGTPATWSLSVTAEIVETPLPALNFVSGVDVATVTLSITDPVSSDAAVESLTVFWGDRYRSEYIWPPSTNIEHTYTRTGTDYHIRVKTMNVGGEEFNYTFINDEDLTVSIP